MDEIRENDVNEAKEENSDVEEIDQDFDRELDSRYDDYLKGKSKEELIEMREQLLKQKEMQEAEAADDSGDADDDEDSEPVLVLKRTLHR